MSKYLEVNNYIGDGDPNVFNNLGSIADASAIKFQLLSHSKLKLGVFFRLISYMCLTVLEVVYIEIYRAIKVINNRITAANNIF
ncbi:hypothetical protein CXF59_05395 [Flavobacterium sp. ALD4]|nr:hypothetical protein CXF59_05395 [Flavobacterium sp. ALD4]